MSNRVFRWGILGTGKIGHDFARAISQLPSVKLHAVASREQSTADEFAKEFDIPLRFPSYEQLACCDEIDCVYVCTPNSEHAANCILLLQHGRNVLCEKPLMCNAREAEAVVAEAKKAQRLFVEGMWTRWMPVQQKVKELIAAGKIGTVKYLSAHIGFPAASMLDSSKKNKELYERVHRTDLGGGAILDVGSYGVSYASFILGPEPPKAIKALACVGEDGIDISGTITLQFGAKGDKFANILMSSEFNTADTALIQGSKGFIELKAPWQASDECTLHIKDKEPETFHFPLAEKEGDYNYPHCSLFQHEALHVHDLLQRGKTESEVMPHAESIAVMRTLDEVRRQVGVHLENDDRQAPSVRAAAAGSSEKGQWEAGQKDESALASQDATLKRDVHKALDSIAQ